MFIFLNYRLHLDRYGTSIFQGFEAMVAGRKYFAFSKYEAIDSKIISKCDETFPGWSHDTFGRNWACYIGHKAKHVPAKVHDSRVTRY